MQKEVLIFIDWYLPGFRGGGPIRSIYNLVNMLKGELKFSIFTRDTDYLESNPYPNIVSDKWIDLDDKIRVYYASNHALSRKLIAHIIEEEAYDVIYLNSIFSKYFSIIPLFLLRGKKNRKVIVAARGMLSKGSIHTKKIKKSLFLGAARIFGLFDGVTFQASSEAEEADIKKHFGKNVNVKLAPVLTCVISNETQLKRTKISGSARMINIARISQEKNLLYALKILREVKGEIEFDIYGSIYNEKYWKDCKLLIDTMPDNVIVKYKNVIEPDKINSTFHKYHFMLLPTTGENFGHIIFESLASGCPVLISDQTPWKNLLEQGVGWDISLGNRSIYVNRIEQCIGMDQQEYDEMSKRALSYSLQKAENQQALTQNLELFST